MNAPWTLDDRMTVALFAGMGGACDGLEEAGFPVHLAINHDETAIAVHSSRHPHTRHLQQDVFEADPRVETRGRGVRMLWASPDCTHFSLAKGSKPVSKRRRSLAWVVCRWAGQVRPETIGLENVWEITTWGPLIAQRCPDTGRVLKKDGTVAAKGERVPVELQKQSPDPRHKGRIWKAWLKHLAGLGYTFEYKKLCCADYGVATIRTRLFGVGVLDGRKIQWPDRTHAPRDKCEELGLKPWVGAHTCIDWSLPMKSIFNRDKPLAEATMRRIARGIMKYVIDAKEGPFIVPITHSGGDRVHSGQEPLRTLTTAHRGELTITAPHLTKFRTGATGASLQTPIPTYTANGFNKRPGGAPPMGLIAAFLAQHNDGPRAGANVKDVEDPISTVTTTMSQQGVIAAALTSLRGSKKGGSDSSEPLPAQSAGGNHEMLIFPFLQAYYSSGGQDQSVQSPLLAVTSKARHGLVCVEVDGQTFIIRDILMRMLDPMEGARAHGFAPDSFPENVTLGGKVKRLTKTAKGSLVGNSVPKELPRLIAELNVPRAFAMEAAQ